MCQIVISAAGRCELAVQCGRAQICVIEKVIHVVDRTEFEEVGALCFLQPPVAELRFSIPSILILWAGLANPMSVSSVSAAGAVLRVAGIRVGR